MTEGEKRGCRLSKEKSRGILDVMTGFFRLLAFGCLAFALLPSAAAAKTKEPKMKDLADTVLSNRITTKFAVLVRAADLASFLSSRGPFTLFAPVDSAFSRMTPDQFAALQQPENQALLQRIVLYHAVNGKRLSAKDLAGQKSLLSCEGSPIPLRVNRAGRAGGGQGEDSSCRHALPERIASRGRYRAAASRRFAFRAGCRRAARRQYHGESAPPANEAATPANSNAAPAATNAVAPVVPAVSPQ